MRRALLPLLLVFLMVTTSWASFSSSTTNIEAENAIQLPVDAPLQWSAAEAAKQWTSTTPSSMTKVPLKESSHQVHTVLGSFDPTLDEPPLPPGPFRDHFDVENTRFIIVQLVEHDRTAFEEIVLRLGLVDLDYIPDDAYLMRLPADANDAAMALDELSNHPSVRAVMIQHPGWRLQPDLLNLSLDALEGNVATLIDVDITPAGDLSMEQVEELQVNLASTGAEEVHCDAWLCQVRGIDSAWLSVLANDGRILFTESHYQIVMANDYARDLIRVDEVVNNHNSGLDGTGEVAAISDTGLDGDHGDFTGRLLTIYSNFGPDSSGADTNSGHGTHVAGSMLGDGSGDSSYIGVAPETTFHFYQLEHDQSGQLARWGSLYDMFRHSRQQSASVQSNSWGAETMGGQYTSDSRSADAFMSDYGDYTVLFAAGNEGAQGSSTVSPPSTAKNVLTVGASTTGQWGTPSAGQVASFSSRGNTLDGRIKPDVVAPGVQICSARAEEAQYPAGPSCSSARHGNNDPMYMSADGTSTATPVAAGATVLVRQFLRTQMSLNQPHSDLIRAIVINGAKDIGSADIPNADEGWGQVDLQRSIYPTSGILALNTFFDQDQSLTPGYSYLYTYSIDGSYGLSVTLVWNDKEGSSSASQSSSRLVNDLDLTVSAPDGTQYKGNVFNNGFSTTGGSHDSLNNVERVKLGSIQSGNWSIQVSHTGGSSQNYAIIITAMGNANPVSDLATIGSSLWVSTSEPLESETLIMGGNWVNQAPSTTAPYDVMVEDLTTGQLLYNESKTGLSGGSSDSLVFTHTFVSTGFHDLRLTIDVNDVIEEPNDFTRGVNNNVYDLQVNVSAIGVRITPYLESGVPPVGEAEYEAAITRHIDPSLDDEVNIRFKVANEGTSNESIDLRVTPVQFVRPDGMLDAPSDEWIKFLSIEPFYQLEPLGSGNNEVILDLLLRDETADLEATPYPVYALPGTYVVDITAWYRSSPIVSHTVRITIIVEDVDGMITALAGVSGITAIPGDEATFAISVMNPGNSPSVYNVSCETPNRWAVAVGDGNSSTITLEPLLRLQYLSIAIRVKVPPVVDGHPYAGVEEGVSCTTSHTGNPSLTQVDSTVITVARLDKFGTDLYSSSGVPVGAAGNALDEAVDNGQHLNLTLTVSNLGNVPIDLDVTVTPTLPSWPLAIFCDDQEDDNSLSLSLVEGESVDCRIEIHVPIEVANGESNTINIRTQFTLSQFITNRTELKVEERPELRLEASPVDVMEVAPGEPTYGTFVITNEGNVPLILEWEFGSVPEGWQVGFKSIPIDSLGDHRHDEVEISVLMPANTPVGPLPDTLTLMVTGTTYSGEELVRSATVGFVGKQAAWLSLSTDATDFDKLTKGEIRTGNLTVTNDGNTPCKVDFEIETDATWVITGLSTIQSLEAGASQTFEYSLMNDGAVGLGTINVIAIPSSTSDAILINGTIELKVSSSSLTGDGGGLLKVLESAGIPSWVVGVVALLLLGGMIGAVLMLRKSGGSYDSGEQILTMGSTMMGSVEQRRDAALDIGAKSDDMVSGAVSDSEVAAALAAAGPKPLGPPKPPGPAPAPLGAPPLPDGSPPPPPKL
ncbi:MAG: S8 family serine peptidase [Candidatus Thalassarchaeaceae archaeon]|nr:S8 family serine peptidase [Candidatus Thalassarchaeaceae archaeon]